MMPRRAVTFDVDWSPDWAIILCADICARAGVPVTVFVTHVSDALADLRRRSGGVELGLHPNFLPGSDHGADPLAVLRHCTALVPEARSMRSHGLVQSTPLLGLVADQTAIEVDVSLLLPFHEGLHRTEFHAGQSRRRIIRLPYVWEDDIAALWPGGNWDIDALPETGLCILDFHPIHVALNSGSMEAYGAAKAFLGERSLASLTEAEAERFRNPGRGSRSFLEDLLAAHPAPDFATVSKLAGI